MSRKVARIAVAALVIAVVGGLYASLRIRPASRIEYDPAYWPEKKLVMDGWHWGITPSGIIYNLYIPKELDVEGAEPSIPLIVCFHGNSGKASAKDRFGRIFTDPAIQARFGEKGAAVLIPQARIEYFSDPHSYARFVRNVIMQHRAIDVKRVAGYGFSQGAAFAQELAMYDPALFRAVVSGSSYYSASVPELFRAARVRFWCATSRNDSGIYEQGHVTGRILAAICPDSRYVEYEKRGHFQVEPQDRSGRGDETFIDWLVRALE